ncbi:MAG: ABC transporter permease [Candidatus Woesearchaeota archaeon]
MKGLLEMLKKNFKLLVRAKISSLVIFIGPLLLVTLLGLAFSQSSGFSLTASIYSEGYTELSESLITKMTNQNFDILRLDSEDDCISAVKTGESQACVLFPAGMDINTGQSNELTFYVDYSQINLVWLMLDVMSARISERSSELSKEMTADLLERMWFVEERISYGQKTLGEMRTKSDGLKTKSSSTQAGIKELDISVDFNNIDIQNDKGISDRLETDLAAIRSQAANLSDSINDVIDSIENSAASAQSLTNESGVLDELDDIDQDTDEIQDTIDDAIALIRSDADNASSRLVTIRSSLDAIGQKISETQSKITTIKQKRDELLPQFDQTSTEIDSMVTSMTSLQGTLDEALQKIKAVKGKSAEGISTPITTKIEPLATQKTHFNSLFPTLIVLIMMITGILLSTTLVMVEKKSRSFFRNNFTPTSYFTFNISTYLTSLTVLFIQLLLFVSVSAVFFETQVLASILMILLIVLLTATVFICIGMFVGFIFKTEETSNLAAITLISVFMLFSRVVIPLESLPGYLKSLALLNPFVISENALKQAIIFNSGFDVLLHGLSMLMAYAIGIFVLLIIMQNALRRLSFTHFNSIHFGNIKLRDKAKASLTASEPSKKKDINDLAVKR